MYTLINGSPKKEKSNSKHFLKYINKKLNSCNLFDLNNDNYDQILLSINNSDTIIFSFPLYVDSPTYLVLKFFDYIIENNIKLTNKNVYVIINCGFLEGEQNITALNIFKNWCDKVNANYLGSLLIGAGEIVGKDKYRLICLTAYKKLKKLRKAIINKLKYEDITTMNFINKKLYCKLANISWDKKIYNG